MNNKVFYTSLILILFIWNIVSLSSNYSLQTKLKNEWIEQRKETENPSTYALGNLETTIQWLVKDTVSSVVNIIIRKDIQLYKSDPFWFFLEPSWVYKKEVWWWSWFFVTKDGYIITNKHVVSDDNAEYIIMTNDGKEYIWKVIAVDPVTDLAVMKAYTFDNKAIESTPLKITTSENNTIGSIVLAIWNALAEFQNTVTFWIISGLNRSIEAWSDYSWDTEQLSGLIQTDAAINPWNSGWPLLNLKWEVIGINTAVANANGIGFAIPISEKEIQYILESIKKYWEIKRVSLWIRYIELNESTKGTTESNFKQWLLILPKKGILKGSIAEKVGLKWGDIILSIDNTEIKNASYLKQILKQKIPWDTIKIQVWKYLEKETKDVVVRL